METLSRNMRGIFFLVTGFIACPCHLVVTLPILLTLTAGTAVGAFLANNVWLIAAMASVYFIAAMGLGLRAFWRDDSPKSAQATTTVLPPRAGQAPCCAVEMNARQVAPHGHNEMAR